MWLIEDEKGKREISNDIEIIAEKLLRKNILNKETILLKPPSPEEAFGLFLIGNIVYNGKKLHNLYLWPEDFIRQIGIFAISGEGKTNLAFLLALQLLKCNVPFLVIDWKRSWRSLLSLAEKFPELKELRIYTVGRDVLPFLWNPFRQPPLADKQLWINNIAEVLEKSHISGPGVAYYFNIIYPRLYRNFKNKNFYPNFFDGLEELKKIKAYERELKWKQTALRIFKSFTLGPVSKVFNSRVPLKLENLLNKPVILELDLEMPKPLRIFFTEIILRWIHLYRLSQGETEKLRHVLFLEEVHNLFPRTKIEKETSNSLENIYREIRAFGQGLVSITQHPSLLPIYLLGNCHTQIYLGLQHEQDIITARKALFLDKQEEAYTNMLKVGEAIVKIKNRIKPCLVKIPLVPVKKGVISDEWLKVNKEKEVVKNHSFLLQPHDEKIQETSCFLPEDNNIDKGSGKKLEGEGKKVKNYLQEFLIDIFKNPLSSVTKRYKRLRINPKLGNRYKNILISQGLIQPRCVSLKNCRIVLFELTTKGKLLLRDLGLETKEDNESVIHKFWKNRISQLLKKSGIKFEIEAYKNGKPDLSIDIERKKIAIEIETGNSDLLKSIEKARYYDLLIIVPTNRDTESKIKDYAKDNKNIRIIPAKKYENILGLILSLSS